MGNMIRFSISKTLHECTWTYSWISISVLAGCCWIGLMDCPIQIAIQFGGLDCDWQSIKKLDFGFGFSIRFSHFNPNPKKSVFFHEKQWTFHDANFFISKANRVNILKQLFDKNVEPWYYLSIKTKICIFWHLSILYNQMDYEWIRIWIVNRKFTMDLDWKSKKIGLSNTLSSS